MTRNWPLMTVIGDFTAGPPGLPGYNSVNLLNGQTALRKMASSRGRQYELGQAQAGTMSLDLTDVSEYLNPANMGTFVNVLANPGFESAVSPWTVLGGALTQSATQKHSGAFAGKIVPDGTSAQNSVMSELIPVVVGRSYTVSGWFWFTTALVSNFDLAIGWFDSSGVNLSYTITLQNAPATTWMQATNTGVAPAGAAFAKVVPVQSGTPAAGAIWYMDDLSFVPVWSPTSPWNTGPNSLLPSRRVQTGTWWNGATLSTAGNLLNSKNQDADRFGFFDPSFESGITPAHVFGTATTIAASTTQHFVGAQSLAATFSAGSVGSGTGFTVQVVPGQQYTVSSYVFCPAGTTVRMVLAEYNPVFGTSLVNVVSSTTAAWQRLTGTFVATSPFVALTMLNNTGTMPFTAYWDALQLELGPSASAFTTTGPTFSPIFTGYIERYPQRWDMAGARGIKPLECVDALSPLSRIPIQQSYSQTVLASAPVAYTPLNDQAFPQVVQRPTGGQQMIGYTQLGSNSGAVNFAGDTFLDGSKAVTISQQNTNPVTSFDNTQLTYLGTRQGALSMSPQSFTLEVWIRWSSGVIYGGAAAMQPGESTIGEVTGPLKGVLLYTSGGGLAWLYADPNGGSTPIFSLRAPRLVPDGQWHHIALVFLGSNNFKSIIDGVSNSTHTFTFTPSVSTSLDNIFLEAQTYFGSPLTVVSAANWAAYAQPLSDATVNNHYQRGIGYLGELTGVRANRLLTKYWSSNIVTANGKTQMSPDFYYSPLATPGNHTNSLSVLQALQDIQATEGGLIWADAGGFVHFDARDTRYLNSKVPAFVFGEKSGSGELPYSDIDYDFDPTYIFAEADLTSDTTGLTYTSINTQTQTDQGQRILSQTMYMANDWDVQQAANFFTQRYAVPPGANTSKAPMRLNKLTLDPASNPSLWAAVLTMDIGTRVTVTRRTSPGVTETGDYYIEQINHNIDGAASTWTVDYQLSPCFNTTAWILGDATYGVLGSTTVAVY